MLVPNTTLNGLIRPEETLRRDLLQVSLFHRYQSCLNPNVYAYIYIFMSKSPTISRTNVLKTMSQPFAFSLYVKYHEVVYLFLLHPHCKTVMANISYLSIQYKIIIHAQAKTTLSSCGPFGHNRNRVSGMEAWHTLFYVHYVRMFFCIMLKSLFFLLFPSLSLCCVAVVATKISIPKSMTGVRLRLVSLSGSVYSISSPLKSNDICMSSTSPYLGSRL